MSEEKLACLTPDGALSVQTRISHLGPSTCLPATWSHRASRSRLTHDFSTQPRLELFTHIHASYTAGPMLHPTCSSVRGESPTLVGGSDAPAPAPDPGGTLVGASLVGAAAALDAHVSLG